jgi:hypothetical protein
MPIISPSPIIEIADRKISSKLFYSNFGLLTSHFLAVRWKSVLLKKGTGMKRIWMALFICFGVSPAVAIQPMPRHAEPRSEQFIRIAKRIGYEYLKPLLKCIGIGLTLFLGAKLTGKSKAPSKTYQCHLCLDEGLKKENLLYLCTKTKADGQPVHPPEYMVCTVCAEDYLSTFAICPACRAEFVEADIRSELERIKKIKNARATVS